MTSEQNGTLRAGGGVTDAAGLPWIRTALRRSLTCVDLFAGCGGLSLGLEEAGFSPLLFSEINQAAASTYLANRRGKWITPVADIQQLTNPNLELHKMQWRLNDIDEVDLVCGGPPCQGFSGIGHRRTFKLQKKEIPSNHLYREMVRVIRCMRPKMFLFENVRGLLNAKWSSGGESGEIFSAVLDAFRSLEEYRIKWDLLHAKDYGVPQNRPRVIMVGIREDLLPKNVQLALLDRSFQEPDAVACGYLPKPPGLKPPNLRELLGDLEDPNYASKEATTAYPRGAYTAVQREMRTTPDGHLLGIGEPLTDHEYSDHEPRIRDKFRHMIRNGGEIPEQYRTKKFAQRVLLREWDETGPNITATSMPDDYVHYSQPRCPTVREWARIQTFPDWYTFLGPRTTGGRRRAGDPGLGIWEREVPKYTQIGNAVPVRLAHEIGKHLAKILRGDVQPSAAPVTA